MPHPNDPKLRSFIDVDASVGLPDPEPPLRRVLVQGRSRAARRRRDRRLRARSLGARAGRPARCRRPRRVRGADAQCLHGAGAEGVVAHPGADQRIAAARQSGTARQRRIARAARWCRWRTSSCICRFAVAGYTDFYSSKEHATNVGVMFRGKDNALQPNWLHMPIGYNGRASTVVVSGTQVRRPRGQLKPPSAEAPSFGPASGSISNSKWASWSASPRKMGEMLTEQQAEEMIFGFVILNDWSARDIQQWEYVPLGPFQAKAFATSISPWIVTREALEPFRVHGPAQDPAPLPYLKQAQPNNYDLQLDVGLRAAGMNEAMRICRTNFKYMYWSSVQQLVHHASSGCAMNVGDLLGSGTISGPDKDSARQPARNQLERHRAGRTARRRQADVPRRRRFARHARLVPGRRLSRRFWRGRGHDPAGGVVLFVIARASEAIQSHAWDPGLLRRNAPRNDDGHRASGGISRTCAQCARHRHGCISDARACPKAAAPRRRRRAAIGLTGRIGRGAKPPPQFGQTFCSLLSTQSAQNVHS